MYKITTVQTLIQQVWRDRRKPHPALHCGSHFYKQGLEDLHEIVGLWWLLVNAQSSLSYSCIFS